MATLLVSRNDGSPMASTKLECSPLSAKGDGSPLRLPAEALWSRNEEKMRSPVIASDSRRDLRRSLLPSSALVSVLIGAALLLAFFYSASAWAQTDYDERPRAAAPSQGPCYSCQAAGFLTKRRSGDHRSSNISDAAMAEKAAEDALSSPDYLWAAPDVPAEALGKRSYENRIEPCRKDTNVAAIPEKPSRIGDLDWDKSFEKKSRLVASETFKVRYMGAEVLVCKGEGYYTDSDERVIVGWQGSHDPPHGLQSALV